MYGLVDWGNAGKWVKVGGGGGMRMRISMIGFELGLIGSIGWVEGVILMVGVGS